MSSFQKTKEIKIIMVGSKVLTSESVLKCFSRFSQYLNRFNSDFDPWIVVGMIIWFIFTIAFVSTRYDGLIKIRISGARWESTPCQIWLNLVKVAKSLREAQVWYKTIKSVVLWGFWRYLTFSQPRVDQGILVILAEKGTLSASMSERVALCHSRCSCGPKERKKYLWNFWDLARKLRADKIQYQQDCLMYEPLHIDKLGDMTVGGSSYQPINH